MELLFLAVLIFVMVAALMSGFPVAFALPGSAIVSIGLASLAGYVFEGDINAFFVQDGPVQWMTAAVTNFRSLYWEVERDTLIAIPLFVFMGIMLQRSRIAEDLLVAMAQLFGPVPGGLGLSVVFVGGLLAATTGIVGATVVAMGMISLPAMLRNNYSKSLASGTICASGTLGQIIPPSIVLIILVDQLGSAADQASTIRKQEYSDATGEFSMPASFDVASASAGDMFMGAFIPGIILVSIYMIYILVVALINPKLAPPVRSEGSFDRAFFIRVVLALVPPLALIFIVLGSIILGIATVNQAGSVGAVGAIIMAGYRLYDGKYATYLPAILAIISVAALAWLTSNYDINVRSVETAEDLTILRYAIYASGGLIVAIIWSAWRVFRTNNVLQEVMLETAKTTSMVFIILLGAAMLTAAFRGFGGEELVREFLTSLPGGFWTQFIVVMAVIFLLGFFLDFIEIAVVVVPIVAPILLANTEANVTAVWLGVMIGMNMQTSFLTPPFGFALFYLRGVAPAIVKTLDIYKGAVAFIGLQLLGLSIAGYYPPLVNYLPTRSYLTSDVAPPPLNPRLQHCIEQHNFAELEANGDQYRQAIATAASLDLSSLPEDWQKDLGESFEKAGMVFDKIAVIRETETALEETTPVYKPVHQLVRGIERSIKNNLKEIDKLKRELSLKSREDGDNQAALGALEDEISHLTHANEELEAQIPADWEDRFESFRALKEADNNARTDYRRTADEAYKPIMELRPLLTSAADVEALREPMESLRTVIETAEPAEAQAQIEAVEDIIREVEGASKIRSTLGRAKREFRRNVNREKALEHLDAALALQAEQAVWLKQANDALGEDIATYDEAIKNTIGVRQLPKMERELALEVAACMSHHRDVSLNF